MDDRSVAINAQLLTELEEAARYAQSPWCNRAKVEVDVAMFWQYDKWAKWLGRPKDV